MSGDSRLRAVWWLIEIALCRALKPLTIPRDAATWLRERARRAEFERRLIEYDPGDDFPEGRR